MTYVTIKGAKGGGGSFKQTPDNLRSTDTFEGVLGLAIGPIKGPTRGLKSVKVDGTALENETGELNFDDFVAEMGDGDPTKWPQKVNLKLGAGASPVQVGLTLANDGGNNPIWATRTLPNTNADSVDLRFIVNQLYRQDKKGTYNATATLEIQLKPVGSTTWINPTLGNTTQVYVEQGFLSEALTRIFTPRAFYDAIGNPKPGPNNYKITGKTTSAAVYELRIALPNTGAYADTAWDIRVRLLERESYTGGEDNLDQEERNIAWESLSAVYKTVFGEHEDWQGVSWMSLYGKASDQLTGVPTITVEGDWKIVSVPPSSVFNPTTRQYVSGATWDGSWAKSWTNDPAWVLSDAISDSLAGLSLIAQGSYLNKWDALEMSKWCSELVPNGDGGTHPRYSLNLAIRDPMKAEEFVRYLAGAVGGLAWDQGDGEWRVKMDKPDNPVDIFTLDNIEGEFIYSHTDVDTRYNDITMTFLNEEMDYREDRVRLYDNVSIAQIGRKPNTIVAVGCTNRQEAMRRGKLRQLSAVGETRVINFTTNRRGRNVEHLDLILVADGDLGDVDKRTTGRAVAISADRKAITLRDTVYVAPGVVYNLRFAKINSGYLQNNAADWKKPTLADTRAVATATVGETNVIQLTSALPADVDINLAVALEAVSLPTNPKLYRVTNVTFDDDGERIAISALEVKTNKWTLADNVSKEDTVFQDLRGAVPMPLPPATGSLLTVHRSEAEQGENIVLTAAWQRPAGAFINGFRVRYRVNGGEWTLALDKAQVNTWDLVNPAQGQYDVEICTLDRRGGISLPLIGSVTIGQSIINTDQIKYNDGQSVEELKPAEGGATNGMSPTEQQLFDQLTQDVAQAQQFLEDMQQEADDTVQRLTTAESTILQQGSDIQSAWSSINANAQSIQTLSQSISANTASIDELWEVVDGGSSGEIAQLTQRVTTAESNITNLQLSMTTALGSIATLTTTVQAGNPNLLLNGGFENGLANWTQNSGVWQTATVQANEAVAGTHVGCIITAGQTLAYISSTPVKISPNTAYSVSGRIRLSGAAGSTGEAFFDILFLDANKAPLPAPNYDLGDGPKVHPGTDFDFPNARQVFSYTVITPAAAVYAQVRCIGQNLSSGVTQVAFQQVKFERGVPTAYSAEASVSQSFTAINTVSGSLASLSSTVGTQGSAITILQQASTTQEGKLATLTTRLNVEGNPNLLKNGGFENGLSGWSPIGGSWAWSGLATTWGTYAYLGLNDTTSSNRWVYLDSDLIQVQELTPYTVSGDLWGQGAANLRQYFDILWSTSAGTLITTSGLVALRTGSIPFGNPISGTVTAPAGAYYARVRPVFHIPANASVAGLVARMIKFERGSTGTSFSSDASIVQSFTVANAANTSVATLSSTVSTQGSAITVVQQSITNLQGTTASLTQRIGTASGNLLGNSEFQVNDAGWGRYSPTGSAAMEWGRDGAGDDWRPTGEHNLFIHQTDGDSNKWAQWHVDGPQQPAVNAGTWYEWSVNIAAHRCQIEIKIEWYNSARQAIATSWSGRTSVGSGGRDLTGWARVAVKGQAPAGASYAVPCALKLGTNAGEGDSWMWFVRPMFREVTADTAIPTPYSPPSGRAVIENIYSTVSSNNGLLLARAALRLDVNGYMVGWEQNNNGSVGNFIINADYFQILKPGGGVRTEYSGGNWRCYDANGTLRTRMGVW